MSMLNTPVPVATPETKPYWEGLTKRELRLCRCRNCGEVFFPPSNVCPRCSGKSVEWVKASGRAALYSYVISERPLPEWGADGAMCVAHVVLEEGPSLVSTVVNCDQTTAALCLDMPLRAVFLPFGEEGSDVVTMLCFEPDDSAAKDDVISRDDK